MLVSNVFFRNKPWEEKEEVGVSCVNPNLFLLNTNLKSWWI